MKMKMNWLDILRHRTYMKTQSRNLFLFMYSLVRCIYIWKMAAFGISFPCVWAPVTQFYFGTNFYFIKCNRKCKQTFWLFFLNTSCPKSDDWRSIIRKRVPKAPDFGMFEFEDSMLVSNDSNYLNISESKSNKFPFTYQWCGVFIVC